MTAPVVIAMIFVGGLVVLPALGQWALQVTEGLVVLLATALLMIATLFLCDHWPDYYANAQMPVAMTATPFAE